MKKKSCSIHYLQRIFCFLPKSLGFPQILKRIQTNVAATARTVKKVIARSDLGHKQARLSPGQYDFVPN